MSADGAWDGLWRATASAGQPCSGAHPLSRPIVTTAGLRPCREPGDARTLEGPPHSPVSSRRRVPTSATLQDCPMIRALTRLALALWGSSAALYTFLFAGPILAA